MWINAIETTTTKMRKDYFHVLVVFLYISIFCIYAYMLVVHACSITFYSKLFLLYTNFFVCINSSPLAWLCGGFFIHLSNRWPSPMTSTRKKSKSKMRRMIKASTADFKKPLHHPIKFSNPINPMKSFPRKLRLLPHKQPHCRRTQLHHRHYQPRSLQRNATGWSPRLDKFGKYKKNLWKTILWLKMGRKT